MNVGFFSIMHESAWGGSEELWAAGARAARRAGDAVAVSVFRWRPRAAVVDALARDGATICERLRWRSKKLRRLGDRLRRHDRAFVARPLDVLCISQGGTYDFPMTKPPAALARLTRDGRVPYVVLCLYNDERSVPSPKLRARTREFFAGAARVGFVSQHNLTLAERQLACRLPNAVVLRNPVNLADTAPVAWPVGGRVARLASVARLSVRHKGQDVLLEALGAPAWRARPWECRIYGKGPDEEYIGALVRHFGLEDRVRLMGHAADVRALWAENELLVVPSRGEGTPLALVEAMLCGRPAVVTDVGGNAEWVEEGATGFVAPAATAHSVGDALERAWQARAQWAEMGRAARVAAIARHDPDPGRTLLELLRAACAACDGSTVAPRAASR